MARLVPICNDLSQIIPPSMTYLPSLGVLLNLFSIFIRARYIKSRFAEGSSRAASNAMRAIWKWALISGSAIRCAIVAYAQASDLGKVEYGGSHGN